MMEKRILPYLVLLSALSVSASAAFYSVSGLGKMFAGASMEVMIMVGSLEVAKLVLASMVYQYWEDINAFLKTYYIIAILILMAITSGGIYGYLSAAYSETSTKLERIDKEVLVKERSKTFFIEKLATLNTEKTQLSENITQLTGALSNNIIQYKDSDGQMRTTTSSANRKAYEKQLDIAQKRKEILDAQLVHLTDTISKIDIEILEMETDTDIAAEIGPLKYIAQLTNRTMDQVVNWFIMALIFVFDPLAVSLVIGANIIFNKKNGKLNTENISTKVDTPQESDLEISPENEIYNNDLIEEIKKKNELLEKELNDIKKEMQYQLTEERAKIIEEKNKIVNKDNGHVYRTNSTKSK